MKKTVFAFILTLTVLALSLWQFALAAETPRLLDTAGLLDEYDSAEVLSLLDKISEKQNMDVVILTVDATDDGLTSEEAATEMYEYLGFSEDGVMLYISMAEREWYILTSGYGTAALTDAGIDYIADNFLYHISSGDYLSSFEEFISYTDSLITRARSGSVYDVGNLPKEPFEPLYALGISLVIGLVIALVVTGIWRGQLKSISKQTRATSYIRPGSLTLTNTRDVFLYRNVTRTERPRSNSSSGGGSSIHRSSSGRSYGGRGGRF